MSCISGSDGKGPLRIEADTARCIAAGQCVMNAPALFDQDDDGVVVVVQAEPPPQLADEARAAVRLCPSGALSISDREAHRPSR